MFVTGRMSSRPRPRGRHLEELGGASVHANKSGVAHFAAEQRTPSSSFSTWSTTCPCNNMRDHR